MGRTGSLSWLSTLFCLQVWQFVCEAESTITGMEIRTVGSIWSLQKSKVKPSNEIMPVKEISKRKIFICHLFILQIHFVLLKFGYFIIIENIFYPQTKMSMHKYIRTVFVFWNEQTMAHGDVIVALLLQYVPSKKSNFNWFQIIHMWNTGKTK